MANKGGADMNKNRLTPSKARKIACLSSRETVVDAGCCHTQHMAEAGCRLKGHTC